MSTSARCGVFLPSTVLGTSDISSRGLSPRPSLRQSAIKRASAPKFINVQIAVKAKAKCRIILRLRPILAHWVSVDAPPARLCVHAVASDNGIKSASSRPGASQHGQRRDHSTCRHRHKANSHSMRSSLVTSGLLPRSKPFGAGGHSAASAIVDWQLE